MPYKYFLFSTLKDEKESLKPTPPDAVYLVFPLYVGGLRPVIKKTISEITKRIIKIINKIFAIPAIADAIPVKPKMAAINDMTKNIITHANIVISYSNSILYYIC